MNRTVNLGLLVLVILLLIGGRNFAQGQEIKPGFTEHYAPLVDITNPECNDNSAPYLLIASNPCGSKLNCGFNTGCAPGKYACCPKDYPYLNMCDCSCSAKKNTDTTKPGGCNVWHECK